MVRTNSRTIEGILENQLLENQIEASGVPTSTENAKAIYSHKCSLEDV